jgi:hypothetical protein
VTRSGALLLPFLLLAPTLHAADPGELAVSAPRFAPASQPEYRLRPQLAAGASTVLAVWEERTNTFYDQTGRIVFRLYDAAGVPRAAAATSLGIGADPQVVWNGSDYLVVWGVPISRFGAPIDIPDAVAMHVSEDGRVAETQPVVLHNSRFTGAPRIAWNGSEYLLADRTALILDRELHPIATLPLEQASGVVAAGGDFLVRASQGTVRVSRDHALTPLSIPLPHAVHGEELAAASAGVDGLLHATLFDAAGIRAQFVLGDARPFSTAALSWDGSAWRAAWENGAGNLCQAAFHDGPDLAISCGATPGSEPALAGGVLAFVDRAAGRADRIAVAWHSSDRLELAAVASESVLPQAAGSLASMSGSTVAGWSELDPERGVMQAWVGGRRLAPSAADQSPPRLAAGGDKLLALWWESGTLFGALLDRGLNVVVAPFVVGEGGYPAAAFNGRDWLVAWETPAGASYLHRVAVAEVTQSGAVTAPRLVAPERTYQYAPSLAWSGDAHVLVWKEAPDGANAKRIVALRLDASGNATSPPMLLDETIEQAVSSPSVAWSGERFVAVWLHVALSRTDVRAANVSGSFVRLDSSDVILASSRWTTGGAQVRASADGSAAVLFSETWESDVAARLLTVTRAGAVSETTLPFIARGFDLLPLGESVAVLYARPSRSEERLGPAPRVYLRSIAPARRRSVR